MSALGGSVQEVAIAGRIFPVTADADVSLRSGGKSVELQPNGDGSVRKILTNMPWQLEGLEIEIDDDRGDLEFLQDIADKAKADDDVSLTLSSGVTWGGRGTVVGEVTRSTQKSSASVTLGGPGKLEQQ